MNIIFALAGVVIKELYRRKDFYVLFVLTAAITLVMGSLSFFNEEKIVRYVKDICLLLIWISSLVIAVTTAARQLPAEKESRTIFPLLAKPVSRAQVMLGKFAGCWLAAGMALVIFYLFFGITSGLREGHLPVFQYLQALWLHWMMLGIVIALVLLGSVVFTAPSSNATICFLAVAGVVVLGSHLNQVAATMAAPFGLLLSVVYFMIPHLELYYAVRERLVFDQSLIAWSDLVLATLYSFVYVAVFLCGAWLAFRRKILTA
jgi:ABC-type transport system involved in multi-copper enzyme maturation permease subunit